MFSFAAFNLLVEERAKTDEDYRKELLRNQKKTLADGRKLTDEQLLAKLHSLGWSQADRDWLEPYVQEFPSAEALFRHLTNEAEEEVPTHEEDWIWIALVCLWERWFPDRPNFEMVQHWIYEGYQTSERDESPLACDVWQRAWEGAKHLMRDFEIAGIHEYDELYRGVHCLSNWVLDFSAELWRAALSDPKYLQQRVEFCQTAIQIARKSDADHSLVLPLLVDLEECGEELGKDVSIVPEDPLDEKTLDATIAQLDTDCIRSIAEGTIWVVRQRPRQFAPHLIGLLHKATQEARCGRPPEGNGHLFALYLLTEFRCFDALPAIVETMSLPPDWAYAIYGDAVNEHFPRILAVFCREKPEVLDPLISDRTIDEYVRWAAAGTYMFLVRDGYMEREEAVARLASHLSQATETEDREGAGVLVMALSDYAPKEVRGTIETAFRKGLVDSTLISLEQIDAGLAEGDVIFQRSMNLCPETGIVDAIQDLTEGHFYDVDWEVKPDEGDPHLHRSSDFDIDGFDVDDDDSDSYGIVGSSRPQPFQNNPWDTPYESATVRNPSAPVGRNEPCPCGSGKKWKKCCGRR